MFSGAHFKQPQVNASQFNIRPGYRKTHGKIIIWKSGSEVLSRWAMNTTTLKCD